jgi:phospholipase A2
LEFLRNSIPVPDISSILSSWSWPESLATVQEKFSALLLELGRGPGSLYSEIVERPPDPSIHPECQWDAEVRLGDELCLSERAFLRERKRRMKNGFAGLFGVDESELDERDLPVVAIAGSGGGTLIVNYTTNDDAEHHLLGYRAMINTASSLIGAQRSGILDCITYTAGISGTLPRSCLNEHALMG